MTLIERPPAPERPMDPAELDEWIRLSRNGDVKAFDHVVGRYYRFIFNLAFRMLGSREAAEDAAQECFLKAWNNLSRFRGASQFSTWLHSIAVRHCLDVGRKRLAEESRTLPLTERGTRGEFEDGFEGDLPIEAWYRSQALREALVKLPDKIQLVIALRYYSDYSVKEIADLLKIPPRTVYSRLEIGLSRLERDLRDLGEKR